MKSSRGFRHRSTEAGVALLIAVFALLLISAVAVTLVVASGTESALDSNYRSSAIAYYAAASGLEEGRGRLLRVNPNFFGAAITYPVPVGTVYYVTNPASGETVDPKNLSSTTTYPDTQFQVEFPSPIVKTAMPYVNSAATVAGILGPPYKWVRINAITEASINVDVDNDGKANDATIPLFYDGASLNLTSTGMQALEITSLAALPNGSSKLLHYVVAPQTPIQVDAAIHTKDKDLVGDALNVTGFTDPVCSLPSTYGIKSGSTITTPGGGNVTGSPAGVLPYAPFPYNLQAIISNLQSSASPIDAPGTGVTGSGSPVSYYGPHPVLGVAPTVTYDSSGAITAITSPGTPVIYYSPGNLTLGTPVIGGATPSGQGVLLVKGNLTLDITNGFNYFGLIVVTGDISFTANPNPSVTANIHGALIGTGMFAATALTNLGGSIFVHQDACLVQNGLGSVPLAVLSFRE